MSVVRRFLVATALTRLIRKDRGSSRITEGYFAPQGGRTSLVRIDGQQCHLVLINIGKDGVAGEERTEVPRAHGDALLDVCGGKAVYERTSLPLSPGRDVLIDRYVTPTGLDLLSVTFDDEEVSKAFKTPSWFGTEVTTDAAYERHALALQGMPEPAKLGLSNAMLDAVLDLLEPRFGIGRFGASAAPQPNGAATEPAAPPKPAAPLTPPKPAVVTPPQSVSTPKPAPAAAAKPEATAPPPAKPVEAPKVAEVPPASPPPVEVKSPIPAEAARFEAPPERAKPELAVAIPEPAAEPKADARIDDVIESLSQALGAAIQQPREPASEDDLAASFERWTVRPRRTQQ